MEQIYKFVQHINHTIAFVKTKANAKIIISSVDMLRCITWNYINDCDILIPLNMNHSCLLNQKQTSHIISQFNVTISFLSVLLPVLVSNNKYKNITTTAFVIGRAFGWVWLTVEYLHTFETSDRTALFCSFPNSNCRAPSLVYRFPLGFVLLCTFRFAAPITNCTVSQWNCCRCPRTPTRQSIRKHDCERT